MERLSRCSMALVTLLLFLLSPGAATALHSDVIEEQVVYSIGGRRGLLQVATPPTPTATPPTLTATPPTQTATPPTQTATPPTQIATPPTQTATPPTQTATPPTQTATPPTQTAIPPTPTGVTPPVRAPVPAGAVPPAIVPPVLPPVPMAPAPAPIEVTSGQKLNAIIAVSVVGGVILIGAVLIFCRCQCLKRPKKLPFQRLQMT